MIFTPNGRLFQFVQSSEQEKKKMLDEINKEGVENRSASWKRQYKKYLDMSNTIATSYQEYHEIMRYPHTYSPREHVEYFDYVYMMDEYYKELEKEEERRLVWFVEDYALNDPYEEEHKRLMEREEKEYGYLADDYSVEYIDEEEES